MGFWAGVVAIITAVEVWAIRKGRRIPPDERLRIPTITETCSRWFRLDTKTGRMVFTGGTALGAWWLVDHMCDYGKTNLK